ncbi:MAG: feruloyl-CoA synthase [Acidobacteriota bacterium]
MAASDLVFRTDRIHPADVIVERDADGTIRARSPHALGAYPETLTTRLDEWAERAPERTFLAARGLDGAWRHLTYGNARSRARHIAQALLDRGLSPERPILILSGNSLEHAVLALAAMYAGVPYAPVAPAYSLMVRDYSALRGLAAAMKPALVFAAEGPRFEAAIRAAIPSRAEVVTCEAAAGLTSTPFAALEATPITTAVDLAHGRVGPETIAKVLFTSGSTGDPKGVINTHRMLCANQQQILSALQFLGDEPPVLCDWLPWNHTFGGNHNVGIALYNGGTLYIDEGRPLPGAMDTSIANLREIATTAYFNVPKGFEMLLPVLRTDAGFRAHFFSRLQLLFYAAAGLRPDVADGFQDLAMATIGRAIPWVTGLGATETSPAAMFTGPLRSTAAHIGAPIRGVHLKATPIDGRLEARVKGPNITPGYWGDAAMTKAAFDEEGYYKMGDAIAPVDPSDLEKGFVFQGRLNEDFKLSTGTWVRVGAVRARLLASIGDLVQDVVITGHGRDDVGALLFPNGAACRALAGAARETPIAVVIADSHVREAIRMRLDAYNAAHPGSSTAIRRARLLDTPPSLDAKEITDKGSLNQRAILAHRSTVVDELYASTATIVLC